MSMFARNNWSASANLPCSLFISVSPLVGLLSSLCPLANASEYGLESRISVQGLKVFIVLNVYGDAEGQAVVERILYQGKRLGSFALDGECDAHV